MGRGREAFRFAQWRAVRGRGDSGNLPVTGGELGEPYWLRTGASELESNTTPLSSCMASAKAGRWTMAGRVAGRKREKARHRLMRGLGSLK